MASNQDTKEKYRQLQEYLPFIERTIAKHEQINRNQVENNQLQRLQGLHKFLKQPTEQLLNMAVLEKVEAVIRNIHSQQMSAAQRRPPGQDWDPRRDIRHNREDRPRGREHDPRHNQDQEAERRAQDWESSDNERCRDGRDRGRDKSFDRGNIDRERNFERSTSREYSRSSSKEYERGNSSRERDYDRANISREKDYDRSSISKERDSRGNSSRETDSNQRILPEADIFRERRQKSLLDLPMPPVAPDPDMPHSSGSWRHQNKLDSRQDARLDRDRDTRNDTRYDDSRLDSRSDAKQVPKQDHRSELKINPKQDPRNVPKADLRNDPRQEFRTDAKGDLRHDPHHERRYDRRQDSRSRTDLTIPLERISRENSSDRPGTHSEHTNTSWREDTRNREIISNQISVSNSGVERGDLRHSRPPEEEKDARSDISKGRDQKSWDNLSPSHSSSSQLWRMGKQQHQYPPGQQMKPPIISSQHTKGPPPDTPDSPDMSPAGEFGVDDTPQSPEASFSPIPPAEGEILNKVKTIPLDSIKQGVDLSLVKKALASLKTSDKTQSQRPNSAQSYRYEDFVGPATTTKTKDDEPYDPEEVWKTETEINPKKSPRVDVDHRQIILGLSNPKKLIQQTSQQYSTDMKIAKDKLSDIPLPPTMSTLSQKSPFPRDISKPIESNVGKTFMGSNLSPPTANKITSLLDKSDRGLSHENVSHKSTPGVLGFQSKISFPSPGSSPVGSSPSQLSQSSKHGNQLNQAPAARNHESSGTSGRSVASGLASARSRDPRTKDDYGDVDMRSPQSTPNMKSPLSQSSPGMGTKKLEGIVERDDGSRIENIRARMDQGASEFIKPGQKGVAISQLEKYKQKKERRLSGSSEIKSPVSDGNKSKPVSLLDSILPNENEDDLTPEPMQLEENSSPPSILSRDPRMNKPEGSSESVGSSMISRDPRMSSAVSSQSMIAGSRDPRSHRDPRMENVNRDPRRDLANRDPRHGLSNRDPRQELLNRDGRLDNREPRLELSNRDPRNITSHRDPRQDQSISRDLNQNAFSRRDPRQEAMSSRDPRNSNFNSKDPRTDSSMRSPNNPIVQSGAIGTQGTQGTQMRDPRFGGNFERPLSSREMWQQTNSPIGRTVPPIGMGGPQVNMNVPPASVGLAPIGMGSNYPSHRVSVPPPSSPQPPLHPAEPVADSLLSAAGSASLISDTYTCLMTKGLPYFANSSYVYHFFEEYLLRDIVIELDYKYQCTGTAYVHFPSHSSAKEAYEKLNGWMMNGCPISLKHITVGFVRQAKNAYEVKNRERESRLGLPEKPRGNGNPYYKPRPPKPPSPPPAPPPLLTAVVQEPSELKKEPETKDAQVKDIKVAVEQKSHHSALCGVKIPAKNSTVLKSFKIPKKKKIEPPKETPIRDPTPPREQLPNKMETKREIKPIKSSKSIVNSKNAVETIKNPKLILKKVDKLKKPLNKDSENGSSSESSTESLDVPIKHNKNTTKKKRFSKILIVTDSSNSDEDTVNKSHDKVFSTADSDSEDDLVIDSSHFHHEDDDEENGDEESETSSQDSEDSLEKPKHRNKNIKSKSMTASPKVSHPKRKQISKKKTPKIAKSKINEKTKAPKRTGRTKKMDPLDGSKITRQNQMQFEKVVILKKRLKVSFPVPQKIMVSLFLNEKKNTRGKGGRRRTEDVDIWDEEVEPVLTDLFKIELDTAPEELRSDEVVEKKSEDVKDVITFGVKKNRVVNYSIDENVPWIRTNFLKKEWANSVRPGYTNRGKKRKNITNDKKNKKSRKCENFSHHYVSKDIKGENEEINHFDGVDIEKGKIKKIDSTDGDKMVRKNEEKDYETDDEIGNRLDAIDSNSDSDEDVVFGVPQSIAQKLQTKRSLEEDSDSPNMNTMRKLDGSESPEYKKTKCDTSFDAIVISDKENISDTETIKDKEQTNDTSEFLPFSAADLLDDADVNDDIPPLSSSVMAAWLNDVDPRIVNDMPDARELARVLSVNDNEDIDDHWPSKVAGNHDKTPITIETTVDNQSTGKKSSSKSTYNSQLDLSKRNNKDDISGFAFKLQMCEQGKGHEISSNFTYNSLLDTSEKADKSSAVERTQITPLRLNFDESKKPMPIAENETITSKYENSVIEKPVEKKAKKAKVPKKTKAKVKVNNNSKKIQEISSKEGASKSQINIQNTIESVIAFSKSKSVEAADNENDADMELLPSLDPSENIDSGKDKPKKQSNAVSSTNKDIIKPLGKSTEKKVTRKRKKSVSSIDESSAVSLDNKMEDELDDGDETGSIIGSVCSLTDDAASMMSGEGGRELKTPDSSSSKKSRKSRNTPMPHQGWRRVTRGAKVETLDVEVTDWDDGGVIDLFQCDLCQYVGRHRVSHLVNFHAEREVPCEFKKEDFGPVLRDHIGPPSIPDDPDDIDLSWIPNKMTFDDNIKCKEDDCEYTSTIRFDLIYHYLDHYPKAAHLVYHCRFCNYMSDNIEMFYDHVSSHTGEYRHSCDRCGHKSYKLSSIHEHHKETHGKMSKSITSKIMILEDGWPYIYVCKQCTFARIHISETETHIQQRHHGKAEIHRSNMTRCIVAHVEKFGLLSKDEDTARPKAKGKKRKKGQKEPDLKVFLGEDIEDDSEEKVQQLIDRISNNAYTPLSSIETHKRMSLLNTISEKLNKEDEMEETNESDQTEIVNYSTKSSPVKVLRERLDSQDALSPRQSPRKLSETVALQEGENAKELQSEDLEKMSDEENEKANKELSSRGEGETDDEESDDEESDDDNEELDKDELMEILKGSGMNSPISNILGNTIQKLTANLIQKEQEREKEREQSVAAAALSSQDSDLDSDSDSDNLVICEDEEESGKPNTTLNVSLPSPSKGPRIRILSAGEINKGTNTSVGGQTFKCGAGKCNYSSNDNKDLITHIISKHGAFKCIAQSCPYIGTTRTDFQSHMYRMHNNPKLSLLVCPFQCVVHLQTIEQLGAHLAQHDLYPNMHNSPFTEQSPPQSGNPSPMKSPSATNNDDESGDESMFKIVGVSTLAPTVASQLFGDAEAMRAKVTSPMIGAISPGPVKPVPAVVTLDDNDDITEPPISCAKPLAPHVPTAVPGMSSLPNQPPTVPIESVFVHYQTLNNFKILTTKLAPEIFKCMNNQCLKAYDHQYAFLNHLEEHLEQNETEFRCCYCLIALPSPNELIQHVITEHSHCQFQCKYCLYRALSTIYMGVHLKNFHPRDEPRYIKVPTINQSAPSNPSIDNFVRPYKCSFAMCLYKTVDAEAFKTHVSDLHGQFAVIACGYCHVHLNVQSLIDHMRLHDINEYQCPYCLHGESEKDHLLRHLLNCHPGRPGKVLLRKQLKQQGTAQGESGSASSTNRKLAAPLPGPVISTSTKLPPPIPSSTPISSPQHDPPGNQQPIPSTAIIDTNTSQGNAHDQAHGNQSPKNQEKIYSPVKPTPNQATSKEMDTKITRETRSSREMQFLAIVSAAARRESPGAASVEGAEGISGISGEGGLGPTEKTGLSGEALYRCGNKGCQHSTKTSVLLKEHLQVCSVGSGNPFLSCYHCGKQCRQVGSLLDHLRVHGPKKFLCGVQGCDYKATQLHYYKFHMKQDHQQSGYKHVPKDPSNKDPETQEFVVYPKDAIPAHVETHRKRKNEYSIEDLKRIPRPSISYVDLKCYHCTFSSKVRLNLVKHLKLHNEYPNGIPVKRYIENGKGMSIPGKQPVNPVPCLSRKEMMFDTMMNLAGSSFSESKKKKEDAMGELRLKNPIPVEELEAIPKLIEEKDLHLCRIDGCNYISADAIMLKYHINTLHPDISSFPCPHCKDFTITVDKMSAHFRLHGEHLYRCGWCPYIAYKRNRVERHMKEKHVHKKLFDFILREPDDPNALNKHPEEHSSQVKDLAAPSPSVEPVWQCGTCKFSSVTQQEMVNHTSLKHEIKSQFKCGYCSVRSSVRASFDAHFAAKHKNKEFRVLCMYYRLDSEDIVPLGSGTGQNTHEPLWKRNDPERLKHIRGILLDDGVQDKKIWMDHTEYGLPENDEFVCPVCRSFKNTCINTFRAHLCKEANYHRYQCELCGITNALLPSLQRHYVKTHHASFNRNSYIELPAEDEKETWVESLISHQEIIIKEWRLAGGISGKDIPHSIPRVTGGSPIRASRRSAGGLTMSTEEGSGWEGSPLGGVILHDSGSSQGRFTCTTCGVECRTKAGLKSHITAMHQARFKCYYCPFSSNTETAVKQHCTSKHPRLENKVQDMSLRQGIVKDDVTERSTTLKISEESSEEHKQEKDIKDVSQILPIKKLSCNQCEFSTSSSSGYYTHMRTKHSALRVYRCGHCQARFNTTRDGMRHHKLKHPNLKADIVTLSEGEEQTSSLADDDEGDIDDGLSEDSIGSSVAASGDLQHSSFIKSNKEKTKKSLTLQSYVKEDPNSFSKGASNGGDDNITDMGKMKDDPDGNYKYNCCHCDFQGEWLIMEQHVKNKHRDLPYQVKKELSDQIVTEVYLYPCSHCESSSISLQQAMDHWIQNHVTLEFKPLIKLHHAGFAKKPKVEKEELALKTEKSLPVIGSKLSVIDTTPNLNLDKNLFKSPRGLSTSDTELEDEDASEEIIGGSAVRTDGLSSMEGSTSAQEIIYRCGMCKKSSKVKDVIEIHQSTMHAGKQLVMREFTREQYEQQFRLEYECGHCGEKGRRVVMNRHSEQQHPDLPPKLIKVKKPRTPKKRCSEGSKDNTWFRCDLCQHVVKNLRSIKSHMQRHHSSSMDNYTKLTMAGSPFIPSLGTSSHTTVPESASMQMPSLQTPVSAIIKSSAAAANSTQLPFMCRYCSDYGETFEEMLSHHTFMHSHLEPGIINTWDESLVPGTSDRIHHGSLAVPPSPLTILSSPLTTLPSPLTTLPSPLTTPTVSRRPSTEQITSTPTSSMHKFVPIRKLKNTARKSFPVPEKRSVAMKSTSKKRLSVINEDKILLAKVESDSDSDDFDSEYDSRMKPFSHYKVNQKPINQEKIYTFINLGGGIPMRLSLTQIGLLMDLNPILRINKHKDVT